MSDPIRVTRRYDAPPSRVFDAWLDPHTASRFLFATPTGRMVRAEIDPRPGGSFLLVDRRDGEDVAHVGEYLALVRPTDVNAHRGRVAFRFAVPKYSPLFTDVTVDLAPDGLGCAVTLSHAGVPPEWAAQTEQGWKGILDALAAVLEGG